MEQEKENDTRCGTCGSSDPRMHPGVKDEGEVINVCLNEFHSKAQNTEGQPRVPITDVKFY